MIRLVVFSLVVVVGVGFAGWFAIGRWAPEWGVGSLFFSAGINLGACWLSFIPLAVVGRRNRDYLPQAAMAGIAVRLFVVGAAALVALSIGPWDLWSVSVGMIVFYLSLLAVETAVAVRSLGFMSEGKDGTSC